MERKGGREGGRERIRREEGRERGGEGEREKREKERGGDSGERSPFVFYFQALVETTQERNFYKDQQVRPTQASTH